MSTIYGKSLKKSLGQNFIIDKNILNKMAEFIISVVSSPIILEIGAGSGGLTLALLEHGAEVVGIEIDKRWCEYLQSMKLDRLHIVHADFLRFPLDNLSNWKGDWILAGNIPYHLTGAILEKMVLSKGIFKSAFLLLPSPLAARVTASTGTKERGRLSLLVEAGFTVKKLLKLSPHVFRPEPKVSSVFLSFIPNERYLSEGFPWEGYRDFLKAIFSFKRKSLHAVLKKHAPFILEGSMIDKGILNRRAESLDIEEMLELFNIYNSMKP